jgi:ryanodine receptor 2
MFLYCILFYRKLVNNHTFFQHPDLIRILRVHENVMAVMMNTLGRRAQAQSDTQAPIQATGHDGEAPPKEKVEILPCSFQFLKET